MNQANLANLSPYIQVYDSDDFQNIVELNFLSRGMMFYDKTSVKATMNPAEVFNLVKGFIPDTKHPVTGASTFTFNQNDRSFYLTDQTTIMITVRYDAIDDDDDGFKPTYVGQKNGKYSVYIWGSNKENVEFAKKSINAKLMEFQTYSVVWSFLDGSGDINSKEIFLEEKAPLIKEFYPWLPGSSVQEYWNNYLDSPECILLLTGVPGTGKTTFIRNMITENRLNAEITYDEKLFKSDRFFLNFINDKNKDVLIIEDADNILYDRVKDDNVVLSKILNISDGLVKNVSKKMVFSTNITDLDRIDQAIIRPGRCYDILDFRKLTRSEAQAVVDAKNLEKELDDKSYTLAELFSTNNRSQTVGRRKVGF